MKIRQARKIRRTQMIDEILDRQTVKHRKHTTKRSEARIDKYIGRYWNRKDAPFPKPPVPVVSAFWYEFVSLRDTRKFV